jgi:hypothetical protein
MSILVIPGSLPWTFICDVRQLVIAGGTPVGILAAPNKMADKSEINNELNCGKENASAELKHFSNLSNKP